MSGPPDFDQLLFMMMKDCKTFPVFLDYIFGFLNRRTIFYDVATDPLTGKGLPPGYAEALVQDTFRRYIPNFTRQDPVMSMTPQMPGPLPTKPVENQVKNPNLHESYNEIKYEYYSWSQTLTELDVIIKMPEHINCKELSITILPQHISIKSNKTQESIFEGELYDICNHKTALCIIENALINIHLVKSRLLWWNCLVTSELKLDIKTLELTEEQKAKIHEQQMNVPQIRVGASKSHDWSVFAPSFTPDSV